MKKQNETTRRPFFTRFLEGQELSKVRGGGPPYHTLKYPSDDDEFPTS